jgi:acyl-CoA hydrolase
MNEESPMGLPFLKLTAEEAAAHARHGQTVALSGFTPAGSPKAIPSAIATIAEAAHQRGILMRPQEISNHPATCGS